MQQSLLSESNPGLRLLFAGDVRLTAPGTDSILDETVQSYFDAHDLRCCNFEGAAAHQSPMTSKKAGPAVLQGKDAPTRILNSGFNLITLANNHVMDYGEAGLTAALSAFSGVAAIGAGLSAPLAYRPYIKELHNVKAGFLAMTECQYGTLTGRSGAGTAWINDLHTLNRIRLLRSECSHVIVICHAGLEDVPQPLPQWREVYHSFIDAGATAVVCHHPHVAQGFERYKQGVILYSLGNLAWEPEHEFSNHDSLLASLTLLSDGGFDLAVRPVTFAGGKVRFDTRESTAAYLDGLNQTLTDTSAYRAEIGRICREFYQQVAVPDFRTITGSLPGSGWQQVKNASKIILRKPALNEPLLAHLLQNETYRWAVLEGMQNRT